MTCVSKMWLLSNIHKVKILSLTIFIYLVSPLLLVCLLGLLIYRGVIAISAKVSRKDLVGMIAPSTSAYASDELYGIPNRNFVCCIVLKGRLSIESLQATIDKKILSVKNAKGLYKYGVLRMYPAKFQKFLFWKLEEEFKVGSHVIMYEKARDNNRIWTEQDLQEIQKNLIRKQWARFSSPWEILLIPNYRTQACGAREVKTVLCVRFHMCVENELSWMKLLVQVLSDSGSEPDVSLPSYPATAPFPNPISIGEQNRVDMLTNSSKSSPLQVPIFRGNGSGPGVGSRWNLNFDSGLICGSFLRKLLIPFKIPYHFAVQIMDPLTPNEWHVSETSLLKRDHVVTLDRFSVQHVKEIKNLLGVSFSSVLMAALSSALRVTFLEAGYKLPSHIKVMLPQHSKKCDNSEQSLDGDGSFCWLNLPTGVSSSRERLKVCESLQKEVELSTRLTSNKILLSLVGLLPFKYHWYFFRRRPWTGVLMNLKGPSDVLNFSDHQIEDVILSSASDSGFVLSFVSYADYLRISLVIDYRLLPSELTAKNLLKNIYAELVLLGIDGAASV